MRADAALVPARQVCPQCLSYLPNGSQRPFRNL